MTRHLLDANGLEATCSLGLPTDAALPGEPRLKRAARDAAAAGVITG